MTLKRRDISIGFAMNSVSASTRERSTTVPLTTATGMEASTVLPAFGQKAVAVKDRHPEIEEDDRWTN